MLVAEIRSYLARYLFSGEDVFKKVNVLSGGERGRLALAKLALRKANLLLLDEPTNHLDIPSQEVLQAVLQDYQGTIILVSHDRYLIDALGTQIWEIDKDGAALIVFRGTYSEHRVSQEKQAAANDLNSGPVTPKKDLYRQARAERNRNQTNARRRKVRLAKVENRVAELEIQLTAVGEKLALPSDNVADLRLLGDDYTEIQNELEALIIEWEQLQS
jgi:ATP-binding cassette subfamily F protein 3